jgi:ATP-dependent Lhr-like helicase
VLPIGRWALLRGRGEPIAADALAEKMAHQLLKRYGVVLRELLARETLAPAWRTVLMVLRRMEARGEVRGGRFVAGLVGEQYALPEAVEALRAVRRQDGAGEVQLISAADPLNLVGILTPGARVSPVSGQYIAFEAGAPVEVGELGAVRSKLRGRAHALLPAG